jgi:hypothetical protein
MGVGADGRVSGYQVAVIKSSSLLDSLLIENFSSLGRR